MATCFDIVTVGFSADLALLRLQARSLRLFFDARAIGNIFVLENDPEPAAFAARFESEVLPEYGDLAARVRLVSRAALVPDTFNSTGWRAQQALKLLIVSCITADAYIVLDAKNHFLRPVSYRTFVDSEGRFSSTRYVINGNMREYFDHSLRYFGLDPQEFARAAMPATTPYILYAPLVRHLITYIEARESITFSRFFLKRTRYVTEFFMYFGFMLRFGIDPRSLYYFGSSRTVTLFTRAPERATDVTRLLRSLYQDWVIAFGLHRNRINHLTETDCALIFEIWKTCGLVLRSEEASAFFRVAPFRRL